MRPKQAATKVYRFSAAPTGSIAEQIFIDHSRTVELNILFIQLPDLVLVFALNGSGSSNITHQAQPDVKKSAGSGPPPPSTTSLVNPC